MRSVKQLKEQIESIDQEQAQLTKQIAAAHSELVQAMRVSANSAATNKLANAETVLKARAEALAQIHAETLVELKQAEEAAKAKEAQARAQRIKVLEGEMQQAAERAAQQFAALEKTVYSALDNQYAEFKQLVNGDKSLTAQQANHMTQSNKAFRYLYELFLYIDRDHRRKEMQATVEQVAQDASDRAARDRAAQATR